MSSSGKSTDRVSLSRVTGAATGAAPSTVAAGAATGAGVTGAGVAGAAVCAKAGMVRAVAINAVRTRRRVVLMVFGSLFDWPGKFLAVQPEGKVGWVDGRDFYGVFSAFKVNIQSAAGFDPLLTEQQDRLAVKHDDVWRLECSRHRHQKIVIRARARRPGRSGFGAAARRWRGGSGDASTGGNSLVKRLGMERVGCWSMQLPRRQELFGAIKN